ncbi:hypothetical protein PAV_141p01890 (plasmid) [Paenibacillus alvei DSM 29]|nr:hypothetical protein PAV_141p01890 [Paenibacillus alvei DSM 29]
MQQKHSYLADTLISYDGYRIFYLRSSLYVLILFASYNPLAITTNIIAQKIALYTLFKETFSYFQKKNLMCHITHQTLLLQKIS